MKATRLNREPPLRYRCVIFDLDGTLLDTRAAMHAAIDAVLAKRGSPSPEPALLAQSMHHGLPAMLRATLADEGLTDAELTPLIARLEAEYLGPACRQVVAFAHAEKLPWRLHANGAWLAICSNQSERAVRHLLQQFDLADCFHAVVGGDTLGVRKPDPYTLHWLMACAGATRGETLLVGDSEVDQRTATAAGIDSVLLRHGYGSAEARSVGTWLDDLVAVEHLLYRRNP
ncbi:MAG: HAD hydrolase-like protein [Steroidobacteraceae bacterium]